LRAFFVFQNGREFYVFYGFRSVEKFVADFLFWGVIA